jgi:hypothetical protein
MPPKALLQSKLAFTKSGELAISTSKSDHNQSLKQQPLKKQPKTTS